MIRHGNSTEEQPTALQAEATDVVVYSTTDYDNIIKVTGNRPLNQQHAENLITSISEHNMLKQNPGILNQNNELIDGQHRLEAAKTLGVPFFFTVVEDGRLEDVQLLNKNNRAWLTKDYLDGYIAQGKQDYADLKQFAEQYKISIPLAINLLADSRFTSTEKIIEFKAGRFEIVDLEKAQRVGDLVSEVRRYSPDMAYTHKYCVRALQILVEKTDPKLLLDAVTRYGLVITRRPTTKGYLLEFEKIISTGEQGIEVRLV